MKGPKFTKEFVVEKVDREAGIVYGFAIVCKVGGDDYWDLQGDHIPESVMQVAATEFASAATRIGSDQHTGDYVGDITFAMPILTNGPVKYTDAAGVAKTGLYIGYKPQDPVHFDMLEAGERTGFSIGGVLTDADEGEIGKGVWSTATVDNFPDSSFLYVKPGGKKDASGKTTPRSNRMFPVRDGGGKVDLPHVRNALARIPDAKIPDSVKTDLAAKAKKLLGGSEKSVDLRPSFEKAYGADGKRKGRTFRAFKIHEISLVTKPAQEGATVDMIKSAPIMKLAPETIAKDVVLTSSDDGHQHVLCLEYISDDDYSCLSWEYSDGADQNNGTTHTHKVLVEDGKFVVSDNAGHGHSIEMPEDWTPPISSEVPTNSEVSTITATPTPALKTDDEGGSGGSPAPAPAPEPPAVVKTDLLPKQGGPIVPSMTDAEIAALQAERDRYQKLAQLSDGHRAYHGRLDAASGAAFLAKSATDRQKDVESAIVYKATDGTVYFAGQEQMASLAKANDELKVDVAKGHARAMRAELAKTAGETLGHCAGTEDTAVAIVAAVNSISDEAVRTAAFTMLKSGNAAAKALEDSHGHSIEKTAAEQSAQASYYDELPKFAKAANLPMITDSDRAKASLAFMSTSTGSALYKAYIDAQPKS